MEQHLIDELRGHEFLPAELRAQIPALYATDGVPFGEKTVYCHFFVAAANWYIAELGTGEEADLAFGHCDLGLGMGEWGYVDISELRTLVVRTPQGLGLIVERDLHFEPKLWRDVVG